MSTHVETALRELRTLLRFQQCYVADVRAMLQDLAAREVASASLGGPLRRPVDSAHCRKGHPLSGENVTEYRGMRRCRTCHREYMREWTRAKVVKQRGATVDGQQQDGQA